MEDITSSSIGSSAIFFFFVTLALYFLLVRPATPGAPVNNAASGNATNQQISANHASGAADASRSIANQVPCTRVPSHVGDGIVAVNGGNNLLSDGLILFKHTKASLVLSDADTRKDRARLLSSLLTGAPPAKGTAVAVSIQLKSVDCPKQRRVLQLLASYFNLFVLLAVPGETFNDRVGALTKLRGDVLTSETLPDHRIIVASSVAGRVAFVRQLQRIELCLDFDSEVKKLLSRFGHRVVIYSEISGVSEEGGISKLGSLLL